MQISPDAFNPIIGLGIFIGAIQCFFGYRIFKFILGLIGFILGGALAAGLGYAISHKVFVALLAGLTGGIVGAWLLVTLFFVGLFLIGAFFGGGLGAALFTAAGNHAEPVMLLISAVVGGVIALIAQKFIIIVATSFGGAWSVVVGITYFITGAKAPTNIESFFRSEAFRLDARLLCAIVLGIFGMITQYQSGQVKEKKPQPQ
jgi:hypothetical protein